MSQGAWDVQVITIGITLVRKQDPSNSPCLITCNWGGGGGGGGSQRNEWLE